MPGRRQQQHGRGLEDVAVQTAPTERGARAQQRRQPDGEYEAGGQRGRAGRQATASAESRR